MHSSAMYGTAIRTISRSIASGSGGASSSSPGAGHEVRAPARGALGDERLLVAAPAGGGEHGERAARGDDRHLADVLGREQAVVAEPQAGSRTPPPAARRRACSAARRARRRPAAR